MTSDRKPGRVLRVLKWVGLSLLALVLILAATAFFVATSQTGMVRTIQLLVYKGAGVNSFEPRGGSNTVDLPSGQKIRMNIKYGAEYPNSYADVWYGKGDPGVRRPTIFYLHGGGWAFGNKNTGDPIAGAGKPHSNMIASISAEGFNIVNLDYALSPEYKYPVPVRQLNEAIAYFTAHAAEYGLDMDSVIVMGGSAGAHITAQYGLIVSDPAYARDIGIQPALTPERLKALGVIVAPLRFSGMAWNPSFMMWSYMGTKDMDSAVARQADVLAHVGRSYPATYLTDGNGDDTFPAHAKEMDRILTANGVDHEFYFVDRSVALLGHGYTDQLETPWAQENFRRMIAFYREKTGAALPEQTPQAAAGPSAKR